MTTIDLFNLPLYWEMVNAERIALFNILNEIKPELSIEIGTKKGGSLQVIAALSKEVYSLDIDPAVQELGSYFPGVNFITGDSKETLPLLLNELSAKGQQPEFILLDGNNSYTGMKNDIGNILQLNITKPLVVLMHDNFSPDCRQGMIDADYSMNPCVEMVEIDFVHGIYSPSELTRGEMWGGFGIIYLNPLARGKVPLIKQSSIYSYNRVYAMSKQYHLKPGSFTKRIKSFLFRKLYV